MPSLFLCLATLVASWFFSGLFINGDDRAAAMFGLHLGVLFAWWHLRARGLVAFNLGTLAAMALVTLVCWDAAPPRAYVKVMGAGFLLALAEHLVHRLRRRRG